MNAHNDAKRSHKIVLGILLVSILLDRYLIDNTAPALCGLAGINPMLVILDIPIGLPFPCGIIPVSAIFVLLYSILVLPYDSLHDRSAWIQARKRLATVSGGVLAVPVCVIAGGLAYQTFQDRLPRHARNAIESFGINTDLYTAYPGYERIRLKGSMVMLCCFFIGLYIFNRRIRASALMRTPERKRMPEPVRSPELSANPGLRTAPEIRRMPELYRSPGPDRSPALPGDRGFAENSQSGRPCVYIKYPEPREMVFRENDPARWKG
jgi:hypothetical protein